MNIVIVKDTIGLEELRKIGAEFYENMVKGVVDVEEGIVAFGGEFHIDANAELVRAGAKQPNVWGFNVYFDRQRESWIEYISLINIRPAQGNTDMEVKDEDLRKKMKAIIEKKIV
jgi:hypothetical protein